MNASAEGLWMRAVRAVNARRRLSANKSLTPAEVAAEAARAGDDRLARLVTGWYYPSSYGSAPGQLSDDDARKVVEALEADASMNEVPATPPIHVTVPKAEPQRPRKPALCELCGAALADEMFQRSPSPSKIGP